MENENKVTNNEPKENYASEVFRYTTSRLCAVIAGLMLTIAIGFVAFYANDNKWRKAVAR